MLAHGGCLLVTLMPVIAAGQLVVSLVFARAMVVIAICGLATSLIIRLLVREFNHQRWRPLFSFLVLAITAMGVIWYFSTTSLGGMVIGMRDLLRVSIGEGYVMLVHLFLIFHVARTFSLLTNNDLLLTTISSLSTMVLLCLFSREMAIVPYFIPLAIGILMLLLFAHRVEMFAQMDRSALEGAGGRRRYGFMMSLRALATTTILSVVLAAIMTGVFQGQQIRSPLLDRLGLELAIRLARKIVAYTHFPEVSPVSYFYLGGETFQLSPRELFQVEAQEPHYWRGNTLDVYNGIGWSRTRQHFETYLTKGGATNFVARDPGIRNGVPTKQVTQHIKLLVPHTGLFLCAYEPVRVDADLPKTGPLHRSTVRVDEASSLYFNGVLRAEAEYTVTSLVKAPPDRSMVRAEGAFHLSEAMRQRYLSLPPLSPRLKALAKRFESYSNPLDRVHAIARFVRRRVKYTVSPPYMPWHREAVDYLLFETRKGYCTHYATAVAVLCRLTGIPARIAVGYAPGDFDAETEVYHVKEMHAHAWTEVFLPGYGWYLVDASPVVDLEAIAARQREKKPGFWTRFSQWKLRVLGWNFRHTFLLIAVGAITLAVLAVALAVFLNRRRTKYSQPRWRYHLTPTQQSIRRAYRRMCALVGRKYRPPLASETPFEYLDAVQSQYEALGEAVRAVTNLYVTAIYSNAALPHSVEAQLRQSWREVKVAARGIPRGRKITSRS